MKTYISMLRGINVGGNKKVSMEKLKKLYESLGLEKVKTYIQSGNVIFESTTTKTAELKKKLEEKISQTFGFEVIVIIRTVEEMEKVIDASPFKEKDENKILVTFLSDPPKEIPLQEIEKVKSASEEFSISGKEIYLFFPDGYGRTKLANNFFERKLKLAATTRNWRTINKLWELAQ